MSVRLDMVGAMVTRMSESIVDLAAESTANEVISAYLTGALRALIIAREMGADPAHLRTLVERMLAECVPAGKGN